MPKLVRLYIIQTLIGFAISAAFVAGLLYFNVVNLWHLVTSSDMGLLAVFLLWLFNGIVFSGVQFGIAIMRMAEDEDDRTGGPRQPQVAEPQPVRIRAETRRDPF